MAIIGLGVSIWGTISNRLGDGLLPIALASLPIIFATLLVEAYYKVDQEHKSLKDSDRSL